MVMLKVWWSVFWRSLLLMPFSMAIGAGIGYVGKVQGIPMEYSLPATGVIGIMLSIIPFYFALRLYDVKLK
jgi:hypothetical protein